MTTKVQV